MDFKKLERTDDGATGAVEVAVALDAAEVHRQLAEFYDCLLYTSRCV